MGKEVLEKKYQPFSGDRRKKANRFCGTDNSKSHPFSEAVNGFQISPRMQRLMTDVVNEAPVLSPCRRTFFMQLRHVFNIG